MRIPCPVCKTENASDATVCTHCAAALIPPQPTPQRMSLLEQAMAKPDAMPFARSAKPAAPSETPPPAAAAEVELLSPAAPVSAPAPEVIAKPPADPIHPPAMSLAKPHYTMPPLPPQPLPRRRRRAPWVLAAVLLLAMLVAVVYEQLQINGASFFSLVSPRRWYKR